MNLQQKFNISCTLEIEAIAARIMGKSFYEFDNVSSYCQAYQDVYNKIASRLVNNKRRHNQNKYYKILFEEIILEKLSEAYASLVAIMDTKLTNYTFANL